MASPYTGAQPPYPAGAHQPPPPAQALLQQNHSLAFRVMRLSRPSLQPDQAAALRFDPRDVFLPEDALTGPDPSASSAADAAAFLQGLLHPLDSPATTVPGDFTFRDRFLLRDPVDALALPGLLVLPQSFGAIYLGETFCSYISINNSSSFEARDVAIKKYKPRDRGYFFWIHLRPLLSQSDLGVDMISLWNMMSKNWEHIRLSALLYIMMVMGSVNIFLNSLSSLFQIHCLLERRFAPSRYVPSCFTNANNIDTTYLEACIENHTKSNLYMDQVDFEPSQQWAATRLEADEHPSTVKSIIGDLCKQPILIRAGGGIYNYLYQLRPSSGESGQTKAEGSSILGKFQITWRTNLGEPGRLQTQNIHSTPTASKDVDLRAVKVPPVIFLERPFMVNLCLTNQSDKTVGPFEVFLAPSVLDEEKYVLVNGLQKLVLPLVEAFESINFDLSMVATQVGVQKISGITLYAVQEKKLYEPLSDIEIFVDAE
ncbi:uncharacterized protein [Oryza sativa Japonica Group]|uniref:uncharacterized protein isoform X1 n=1 Tax=Oryza sativa subsp. japonica TaxID=39947 RepID=UPI00339D2714